MTTVFGIKHPKIEATVLVADRQATSLDQQTGIPNGKFLGRKLWKSEDKEYCFGHAGNMDKEMYEFVQKLSSGKFDVKKITKEGYFNELRELNIKRLGREIPDIQKLSGIILTTRFDKSPKLYTCFPLGNVEERIWTCAGSGDQKINEYMQALQVFSEAQDYLDDASDPKMQDIIRVGLEAVRRSQSQDMYSHGLDMITCTPDNVTDHYRDLGDDFGRKLKKIQKQYKNLNLEEKSKQ